MLHWKTRLVFLALSAASVAAVGGFGLSWSP
jgi:hypothetical protein